MENRDWESLVIASDLHIPYQDMRAVRLLFYFLKEFQPDYLVLNGDVMDCWAISKFDKSPKFGSGLADEIEETIDILKTFRKICPNTKMIYIEGNHEFRLRKYIISVAKELEGLRGLSIQEQLGLKDMGIEYVASLEGLSRFGHNYWKTGNLYIGHYNRIAKHAGYTAKNLLDDLGVSLIQAHTHRFGTTSKTLLDRELIAVEQGCLCDLKPSYVVAPNWQAGFCVVFRKKTSPRFQIYPVRIPEYAFFWGSHEYTYDEAMKNVYGTL